MVAVFTPAVALVTGANRGLGVEICRQIGALGATVHAGARDLDAGEAAAEQLRGEGLDVRAVALDVTSSESVRVAAGLIAARSGRVDALVNNAGGPFDFMHSVRDADLDQVARVIDANALGPWRVTQAMLPLLRAGVSAAGGARVVNLTSEAGSFSADQGLAHQGDHLAGYAVAKAALNAVTVKLADVLSGEGILVNAISPGFVATYPGTAEMGARPVPDGAAGVVWGVTLPHDGPTGGFFRDGEPLAW